MPGFRLVSTVDPPTLAGLPALIGRLRSTASGARRMVGVAGPPGSGKTHLCHELVRLLPDLAVAIVPMDGFHLDDGLLTHLGLASVKGRPDTFDAAGFVALLRRLRSQSGELVVAPRFDRTTETAVAGAIAIGPEIDLVLVEGNYLLLPDGPWGEVAEVLDEVWYLDVADDVRQHRLLARHRQGHGDEAGAWIARVDEPNAALVAATRSRATVIVRR